MADNKDDKTAESNEAESVKNEEKRLNIRRQYAEERIKELQVENQSLDNSKKSLENDRKKLENELEILKLLKQSTDITKDQFEKEQQRLELELKRKSVEADLSNQLSGQVKSFIGINGNASSLLGKMVQVSGEGGNVATAFADAAKNLASSITFANILAASIDAIVGQTKKLFTDMDQAFAQFEKTAGGVDAFKGRIVELRNKNVEYAVSIQDASKAFGDLKTQFAGFAGLTESTQNALATTTAQMEKLGVSSSETIKIQSMLVKGFQMTGEQAGNMQKQLMATAKSMGLPMQQVVKEFANASNNMKAHGANMQKVFLDLQNQAKNTGIEFTRLQDITGKFDTFDGAADAAGNLNAILGGDYLNSIQLLNADEGERVRLMQDALKASGKSYEAMSKQEKMAAAQALGLQDVTELQKLMNNETEAGTVEALNKAEAEKELAKSTQNVTTMQEKLTAIMGQFAIVLTPILDILKSWATTIGKFMSEHKGFAEFISRIVVAVAGFYVITWGIKNFMMLKSAITEAGGVIPAYIKSLTQKTAAQKAAAEAAKQAGDAEKEAAKGDGGKKLGETIKSIGEAAKGAWREILAFGAAMLMIGGGIALAALGLAQLVKAFQGLTGEQVLGALGALIIVMGGFALMLYILTGAALPAALPMLALGAAFLMIGAGIAIAALGLAQFVKSFKGLENAGTVVMALTVAMGGFALIVWILAPALTAFAGATTIAGGAAIAAAGPLLALGAAFLMIGVGVAAASVGIGYMVKNIVDLFQALNKANPANISASFAAIFDSITLSGLAKFTAFSESADGLTSSLTKLAVSLSAVAVGMKAVAAIDAVFNPAAANSGKTATASAPAAANTNTAGGSSTNVVPVAIYIDSKKIGEILDPRYKKMIDDKLNNIGTRTVPI